MTISASLSGHVPTDNTEAGNAAAAKTEQDFADALAAFAHDHADILSSASVSGSQIGGVDLTPFITGEAPAVADVPADTAGDATASGADDQAAADAAAAQAADDAARQAASEAAQTDPASSGTSDPHPPVENADAGTVGPDDKAIAADLRAQADLLDPPA